MKKKQNDGESFDAFYTAIRKLVENCNFGEEKNRMLEDKIVIGVQDKPTQQKLLEVKDLSLYKAVDIFRSVELCKNHDRMLNNLELHTVQARSSSHTTPIHKAK